MDMATYCKRQGMTLAQFEQYQTNIKTTAQALFDLAKSLHKTDTGIYYPINEIMTYTGQHTQQEQFILNALCALGMEFYNDRTEWRI